MSPEAYPLFADVPVVDGVVVAPRILELHRAPHTLVGDVHRRYMQGAKSCEARAPLHVPGCKDDTLELVLADPPHRSPTPRVPGVASRRHREIWRR